MPPTYDINKIKFATDEATYQRAVGLYESGKVTEVEEAFGDFTAVVLGTKPYRVSVSGRRYQDADCTCYLGKKGTLCKHAVALALHAVMDGQPLSKEEKLQTSEVKCSDIRELLKSEENEPEDFEFEEDDIISLLRQIRDSLSGINEALIENRHNS